MRAPVRFGKYLLLDRISVGGMAEVFKAKSYGVEGFEKIIAIKRILPPMGEDRDAINMFIDEAKIASQLAHANICQIFELGQIDGSHFIAMEYIWGKDLLQIQNRLRRLEQAMPIAMACFGIAKVLEGLDYAHRKQDPLGRPLEIIHRDCSPQNVLVSYEGEVKVIDFGIAKATSRNSSTMAGVLKGKFGYMSPEQVSGRPLDRRSDIFAIGTMLYECLTGDRLFQGETDFSTLEKVRNVDIRPPRELNPNIPEALEAVILKALAKDVDERYQWCSEMLADLQAFLMSQDVVFTAKSLSSWLKDVFAADIARERQRLEQYFIAPAPEVVRYAPQLNTLVDLIAPEDSDDTSLRFGPYIVTRAIGQGGMGKVYEARHEAHGRRVAIKAIHHFDGPSEMLLQRFFAEARAAASIEDPGIVQVFDVATGPDPYIVMEYLEGETLGARIARDGRLALDDVLRFGQQIARTLECAHAQGLIHRDIKPENIFLIEDPAHARRERTKILDWGIAKIRAAAPSTDTITASGVLMGTPAFMSPEQCRGAGGVDHRSDIYSLGCTLFCALTGRSPFEARHREIGELILAQMRESPPAPGTLASGLPSSVDQVILKCLAKRPEARYVSMSALGAALRAVEQQYVPVDDSSTTLGGFAAAASSNERPASHAPLASSVAGHAEVTRMSSGSGVASLPLFVSTLLASLFGSIKRTSPTLLELANPYFVARRLHYHAFFEDLPPARIRPLFSPALNDDLARIQTSAPHQANTTVFVFTWTTDLSTADRGELWRARAYDAITIVPLSLRELQAASAEGWARQLFLSTIRTHEHVPDPFKIDATAQSYEIVGHDQIISEIVTLAKSPSGYMIALSAPPAGGKSAVLAEVRNHLGDHRCVVVQCKNVSPLIPSLLAVEMLQQLQQHPDYKRSQGGEADDVFSDIIAALRSEKHDPLRTVVAGASLAIQAAQPWLLILEDVDWAIEALASPDSAIRISAQSLWTGLAELGKQPSLTVLVTGVRTEQLRSQRIADWRNPLKAAYVRLPMLDDQQARHLVTKLGASVGFVPSVGAMAAIVRHGGGSALALRVLCSQILRDLRRSPRYNPLAIVQPARRDVKRAVATIASSDQTFSHLFLSWLDKDERAVLAHIAHNRPRGGLAEIASVFGDPDVIQKLEAMEIVTRIDNRFRIGVPLLECWVRQQLARPEAIVRDKVERRWSYAVGGISLTAVLVTSYVFKIRTDRVSTGTAAWSVEYPERGHAGEVVSISVYEQPPLSTRSELIPIRNASVIKPPVVACDSHQVECRESYEVTLSEAAADRYDFRIVSRDRAIDLKVDEDMLSSIRTPVEAAFRFLAGIPALLGMFVAFRQDLGRGIRGVLGGRDKPARA